MIATWRGRSSGGRNGSSARGRPGRLRPRRGAAGSCAAGGASVGLASGARATRPRGPPVPSRRRRGRPRRCGDRSSSGASRAGGAPRRSPTIAVALFLLELVGRIAAEVADLDPGLLHPLVDDPDEVLATLLGERRDVEPHDRAVDVGHQPDVALGDRLLDGAQDAAIPGLDDDLVRLRDADPGELVERRGRAVVLDVDALDERRRGATGPDALEVALHGLDRAAHLVVGIGDDLGAHAGAPPAAPGAPEMRVPTGSPAATRVMLSGRLRSKTTMGRSFSMHRLTAVASRTLSWSRSRSA